MDAGWKAADKQAASKIKRYEWNYYFLPFYSSKAITTSLGVAFVLLSNYLWYMVAPSFFCMLGIAIQCQFSNNKHSTNKEN